MDRHYLKTLSGKGGPSKHEYVSIDVKNIGIKPVAAYCRVDNSGADGSKNCVTDSIDHMFEVKNIRAEKYKGKW